MGDRRIGPLSIGGFLRRKGEPGGDALKTIKGIVMNTAPGLSIPGLALEHPKDLAVLIQ